MIDFEDVEIVAWSGGGGGGPAAAFIGLLLVVIVFCIAMCNADECSRKTCPHGGTSQLMNHTCLCVEEAR
jgi:hypothetical protein